MKSNSCSTIFLSSLIACATIGVNQPIFASSPSPITKVPAYIPASPQTVLKEHPKGICVFDIDNTLLAPGAGFNDNGKHIGVPFAAPSISIGGDQFLSSYAKRSLHECLKHGYGIAFSTSHWYKDGGGRDQLLLKQNSLFTDEYYANGAGKNLNTIFNNAATEASNPDETVNSIYQYHVVNKGSALTGIFFTYFGNTDPAWKQKTNCVVMFDDHENNISTINAYNKDEQTKYRAIKLKPEHGLTECTFKVGLCAMKTAGCDSAKSWVKQENIDCAKFQKNPGSCE